MKNENLKKKLNRNKLGRSLHSAICILTEDDAFMVTNLLPLNSTEFQGKYDIIAYNYLWDY